MRVLSRARGWAVQKTTLTLLLLLFCTVLSDGCPPAVRAAQSKEGGSYQISVDVSLVVLHATVRDRKGHLVSGLHQEDFQVFDDSVAQHITLFRHEDVPVTVGLVVDHSGSMKPKIGDVIDAANTFARVSNPSDRMFVVNFNENVTLGLPTGRGYTADAAALERAISQTGLGGKTALYDAITEALAGLNNGHDDKKVLIVISDGGDNASRHKRSEVVRMAEESNAIIYSIGLFGEDDPDRNPKVLEELSRVTGGQAFFPEKAEAAVGICRQIARDIRNQYTIGYTPDPAPVNNVYRTIRVVARPPGKGRLFVRTRTAYIPASKPADEQKGPR